LDLFPLHILNSGVGARTALPLLSGSSQSAGEKLTFL
jgi:hypothetical protein